MLSMQNFFQESCLALRTCALYRFLRALKRVLELSLRSEFLHLLSLHFNALTCFLRALSLGDHRGTYLIFGEKGGKRLLLISPSLYQISVIVLSNCSFVVALLARSILCCLLG